jgi:hypothetical protein
MTRLKEYITYSYTNGTLDVYDHAQHVVHQAFNSDNGLSFRDVDAALAWLRTYFPEFFN